MDWNMLPCYMFFQTGPFFKRGYSNLKILLIKIWNYKENELDKVDMKVEG